MDTQVMYGTSGEKYLSQEVVMICERMWTTMPLLSAFVAMRYCDTGTTWHLYTKNAVWIMDITV